jgi:hypothetical protein
LSISLTRVKGQHKSPQAHASEDSLVAISFYHFEYFRIIAALAAMTDVVVVPFVDPFVVEPFAVPFVEPFAVVLAV